MIRKGSFLEEISKMKNLMVYKNGEHRNMMIESFINEGTGDDVKEVQLTANFNSGKWAEKSMPKKEIVSELREAIDWLKQNYIAPERI